MSVKESDAVSTGYEKEPAYSLAWETKEEQPTKKVQKEASKAPQDMTQV
jgi:hypothetical protein